MDQSNTDSGYYCVSVKCVNCDSFHMVSIPKGTRVADFLDSLECFNCGCKHVLVKQEPKAFELSQPWTPYQPYWWWNPNGPTVTLCSSGPVNSSQ